MMVCMEIDMLQFILVGPLSYQEKSGISCSIARHLDEKSYMWLQTSNRLASGVTVTECHVRAE
jgi:hypothetical protein